MMLGGAEQTPTQRAGVERSRAFHAEIARRASLVKPKPILIRFVPNAPFGVPKIAGEKSLQALPRYVPPLNEADYWPSMWFHDLVFGGPRVGAPSVDEIMRAVCEDFAVRKLDLISARRTADIVLPRQITFYLCKTLTTNSFPSLGRRIGGRDHTTVLHSVQKITRLIATQMDLAARVEKIKAALA